MPRGPNQPEDSYADYWRYRTFNAPGAGFDPKKPTATRDQFGEWSVTDSNDAPGPFSPQHLESLFVGIRPRLGNLARKKVQR